MVIKINGEIIEFENKSSNIKKALEAIEMKMEATNDKISHLVFDGVSVFSDFDDYFKKNIENIKIVEVVVQRLSDIINETLQTTNGYLSKVVFQLNPLAEAFYQKPDQNAWSDLVDFFEGIEWVINSANRIDNASNLEKILKDYQVWNEYYRTIMGLCQVLPELEGALLSHDQVLIGDLILYEVLPVIEKAQKLITELVVKGSVIFVS